MQRMKLADDLIPAVKDGTKTLTIREGFRDIHPGSLTLTGVGSLEAVEVNVVEVVLTTAWRLPTIYWLRDGFGSFRDAVVQMRRFYPAFSEDSPITAIVFETNREGT